MTEPACTTAAETPLLPPFEFEPILKRLIWGGSFIKFFKKVPDCYGMPIGESWEISGLEGEESVVASGPDAGISLGELVKKYGARLMGSKSLRLYGDRFPIMVKFIDAARDLSVQVHPDAEMARELDLPSGKNELWHILRCSGGARIYAGFARDFSPEEYDRAVADGTIMQHIIAHRSRTGDTFYLPAGTIHSIGAGNFLIEVQQTSGTTYRVFDFNRRDENGKTRELHTSLARRALTWERYVPEQYAMGNGRRDNRILVRCDWSTVRRHEVRTSAQLSFGEDSFTILSCIDGEISISYPGHQMTLLSGCTVLIAAEVKRIKATGTGTLISVTL